MSLRDLHWCRGCLQKQGRIDHLEAKVARLEAKLRERERQLAEGPFGSSTPSSKAPFKENSLPERQARQGGAKPGHVGHGRKPPPPTVEVLPPEPVAAPLTCPDCHGPLVPHDTVPRRVHDLIPARRVYRTYQLARSRCRHCHTVVTAATPGVLPRHALSNRLLATALCEAYAEGLTLGQVARRLQLPSSALVAASQRVAGQLAGVYDHLIADFRAATVRHADETTWRDNGANTYAWLFATTRVSVFALRPTRGKCVPLEICGDAPLAGTLNVDRYVVYHALRVALQFCFAHLLRDLTDLLKQYPDQPEVAAFVAHLAPRLAAAMELRTLPLSDEEYYRQALRLKRAIISLTSRPAIHPAVRAFQNLFYREAARLYHWVRDRAVPPDNNFAERTLRPLIIARKLSFGCQSARGCRAREVLMSVLDTLRKRGRPVVAALTAALDHHAAHPTADLYPILFPNTS